MSDETLCEVLDRSAASTFLPILRISLGPSLRSWPARRRIAGEIATKLKLISEYLGSIPPYWIDEDTKIISRQVLRHLTAVCTEGSDQSPAIDDDRLAGECRRRILDPLGEHGAEERLAQSIKAFFQGDRAEQRAEAFNSKCSRLLETLSPSDSTNAQKIPESFESLRKGHGGPRFSDELFRGLALYSQCIPRLHASRPDRDGQYQRDIRHPARLHLPERDQEEQSHYLCVASTDMVMWQEVRLEVSSQPRETLTDCVGLTAGTLCTTIEQDLKARVVVTFGPDKSFYKLVRPELTMTTLCPGSGESLQRVLTQYYLSPRDKIILAYAVAKAYWQFYDSELMRAKWTSETIWFMPEEDRTVPADQLPLKAYLTLPLGATPGHGPPDVTKSTSVTHQHPRIFAIALLLLQIGLAEPFPAIPHGNPASKSNLDHRIAHGELQKLEGVSWEGFANKRYFDDAVRYCLDSSKFVVTPGDRNDLHEQMVARKRIFYKNVVQPLGWLATKGFLGQTGANESFYLKRKKMASQSYTEGYNGQQLIEASFHGGNAPHPKEWLKSLQLINAYVEKKRRAHRIKGPTLVAVLDTGFDRGLAGFDDEDEEVAKTIAFQKDFVNGSMVTADRCGHGTFMTKLIMECAPSARLAIARVAENSDDLEGRQEAVAKAILWAGCECKADVISMSFGFPRDNEPIRAAIECVRSKREDAVVFLASAGNSPFEDECFPARHASVISIQATNHLGTFLELNPKGRGSAHSPAALGTFGDGVPVTTYETIKARYPDVGLPGASIATAVAAAISATMLSYVPVLQCLDFGIGATGNDSARRVFNRLRESRGMEAVFRHKDMAQQTTPHHWFVNPVRFWTNKPDEQARCCAIYDCLQDVDSKREH